MAQPKDLIPPSLEDYSRFRRFLLHYLPNVEYVFYQLSQEFIEDAKAAFDFTDIDPDLAPLAYAQRSEQSQRFWRTLPTMIVAAVGIGGAAFY